MPSPSRPDVPERKSVERRGQVIDGRTWFRRGIARPPFDDFDVKLEQLLRDSQARVYPNEGDRLGGQLEQRSQLLYRVAIDPSLPMELRALQVKGDLHATGSHAGRAQAARTGTPLRRPWRSASTISRTSSSKP